MLAHGADGETEVGFVEDEGSHRHQQEGGVDKQVMAEEDCTDERDLAEQWDGNRFESGGARRLAAEESAVEEAREAQPHKVEGHAGHNLVGLKGDGEDGEEQTEEKAGEDGGTQPGDQALAEEDDHEAVQGAAEHAALQADVEHTGPLGEHLANGSIDEGRGHAPGSGEYRFKDGCQKNDIHENFYPLRYFHRACRSSDHLALHT